MPKLTIVQPARLQPTERSVQAKAWSSLQAVCDCCFPACLQSQREPRPEHVIVETTGMAKPLPILTSFMMWDVAQHFDLDGKLLCMPCWAGD